MITNIKEIGVKVNVSGYTGWRVPQIAGERVWIHSTYICDNCKAEQDSYLGSKCKVCNTEYVESYSISLSIPEEYEMYSARKKPQPVPVTRNSEFITIREKSQYRFDIARIRVKLEGEYAFSKNPYRIAESKRIDGINYDVGLTALYKTEFKILNSNIEVLACYSYDINKKPGERKTLEIDGQEVEINKKNLQLAFGDYRCVDAKCEISVKTNWIRTSIINASGSRALRNALFAFEEPNLRLELAVKHGMNPNEIIVKNPTATKLHEILGISKACLRYMTDSDETKYSDFENNLRLNDKKFILNTYHTIGDKYKDFLSKLGEINQYEEKILSNYNAANKLLRFFELGYDLDRLYQYLTEDCKWQQGMQSGTALNELYDYVDMCVKLELNDFDRYPKALKTKHDIIAMRYNSVKMNSQQEKDFEEVINRYKKLEYKSTKYLLKIAKSPKELVHEGHELNHCVGSYADRMANETNIIFFMRDIEDPDTPLVTIEINKEGTAIEGYKLKLGQCKGSYNRGCTPQEKIFLNNFKKTVLSRASIDETGVLRIEKPEAENKLSYEELEKVLLENADTMIEDKKVLAI